MEYLKEDQILVSLNIQLKMCFEMFFMTVSDIIWLKDLIIQK